ncbi:tRNA (5-methylaminomethyl-2-thiouridine)(34)-methyltransferase MnmD [Roseovarius sp. ZX-A-9]|uniref:tRNA (5-methylaminomethyl-2-thiouridine)(34)-methyltransferase MnmD n=1 Tax=Roseovarius sp. ZX-A-9 TaxID=3014783 RepID=UPI00232CD46D|nr:tRNA (5-methylaminomethyl-2-thiouridine)(34)-methyltransferase MnmD [Roseovarius sp. ZX-A-9]
MQGQQAELEWQADDVPVSVRFDDPYFSREDGLAETQHVFLKGNGLPARFRDGFHIAELGFGTGLNMLAALIAWQEAGAPGQLHLTSFEAYPMRASDMARALAVHAALDAVAAPLLAGWEAGGRQIDLGSGVMLQVITGDARQTLPEWQGMADAWFLDGFSPAKNPELWQPPLMQAVFDHTAPGGTAATYTAAGFVRRGLAEAGFDVTRQPGFGRKRHMTVAERRQ